MKIGNQKGSECIVACIAKRELDTSINGVVIYSNSRRGGCWCEKNMKKRNKNWKYQSCVLKGNIYIIFKTYNI